MKLLIGYDGPTCAGACLGDLRRASLPREAEAIVLTVSEIWLPHLTRNNHGLETDAGPRGPSTAMKTA